MRTLLLAAACLLAPAADPLRYAPSEGLALERRLEGAFQMSLSDWNVVMNGREVPSQYLPQLEIAVTTRASVEARDELREVRDGRPAKLRREYRAPSGSIDTRVSVNGESDASSGERTGQPSLGECTVAFEGESQRKLEKGEASEAALAALALDWDFTELLPADGDEKWDADIAVLNPFDARLAGIAFDYGDDEQRVGASPEVLLANSKGMWRLERVEEREQDGLRLCVVRLEGDFETFGERRTELVNVPVASGEADERTDYECSVEGELVWNATHGVLHSLDYTSEGVMRVRTVRVRDGSGTDTAYEQTMNFACKSSFSATSKAR